MKVLTKRNKILSIFHSINNFDPFFFGLLMDSISDAKMNSIIKKKPQIFFILYSNIFRTKKLNFPLIKEKEKTLGLQMDKVNPNINLLYSIISLRTLKIIDQQVISQLNKNLFYKFYLNRSNKILTSQVRKSIKIIKSWEKI